MVSKATPDASPSGSSDWLANAKPSEVEEVPAGNLSPRERGTSRPSLRGRWRMAILVVALGLLVAVVLCGRRHDARWLAAWGGRPTAIEPPTVLPREAEQTNRLGMRLVLIRSGAFRMGSADPGDDLQGDGSRQRGIQLGQGLDALPVVPLGYAARQAENEVALPVDAQPLTSPIAKPPRPPIHGRSKRQQRRGGQQGHLRHTRPAFPPEQADHTWIYEWPEASRQGEWEPLEEFRTLQQVELVEKLFEVTEYCARLYRHSLA